MFALWVGCSEPSGPERQPLGATPPVPPAPAPTTEPWTPPAGPCPVDDAVSIASLSTRTGFASTLLEVDATLTAPATLAVQCTSDDDPSEVFFAESTAPDPAPTVRLSGLVPRTGYHCSAAPVCPASPLPPATFTHRTVEAPEDLAQLAVVTDPELGMGGAWTLAPYSTAAYFGDTWLVVWGPDGRPRWWWPTPEGVAVWLEARLAPDGAIVWGGGAHAEGRVRIVDPWDGERYAWAPPAWEQTVFHHDGKRVADGRLMTLEVRQNTSGAVTFDGFGLRLHDPETGAVSFDYDSQGLVDAGVLPPGTPTQHDPWHANWMDWQDGPAGPEVYVSLCFSRQILAIGEPTGDLRWQLGAGLGWTVVDADGVELGDEALPQCQHGIEVEGDRLLVYDNGQERDGSSVSEWRIDPAAHTATRLWLWEEAGWQLDYLGDVDALPDDRVLVTEATTFGPAQIVEVDRATGRVASRMSFDDRGYTYRAERIDGCALFTSVSACASTREGFDAVAALLGRPVTGR